MPNDMITIASGDERLDLDQDRADQLNEYAKAQGVTTIELIRRIIARYTGGVVEEGD